MSEKDDPLTTTTIGSSSPLETIVEAGVSSSSFSALDLPWEAVALQCRETGTILQWIATQVNNNDDDRTSASTTTTVSSSSAAASFPHALLGIQLIASTNELSGARESLFVQMREQLSSFSSSWKLPILARWSSWTGRTIAPHHLLGTSRLPVLQLDDDTTRRSSIIQNAPSQTSGTLKELVIPTYDDAEYVHRDGQTLLERLSGSPSLTRPVTGLYRLPNGLTLRPLPTARHDRLLPGPSLIFHKSSYELESLPTNTTTTTTTTNTATLLGGLDFQVSKIGYTGHDKHSRQPKQAKQQSRHDSGSTNTPTTAGGKGQLMIYHDDVRGLDIRFCASTQYSSMFAEAQDSLLAASLPQLQSTDVLQDGTTSHSSTTTHDPKWNRADCWVEVRANLAQPMGYWKTGGARGDGEPWMSRFVGARKGGPVKAATAPDLPYE